MAELTSSLQLLKSLPVSLQSISYNERKALFQELTRFLVTNKCAPSGEDNTLRFVTKVLLVTVLRYNDRKSRTLVVKLVADLLNKYKSTGKHLVTSVYGFALGYKNVQVTTSSIKVGLTLLSWIVQMRPEVIKGLDAEVRVKLVETVALLMSITTGPCSGAAVPLTDKAYVTLAQFWKDCYPIEDFARDLAGIDMETGINIHFVILWGYLLKYCLQSSNKLTKQIITDYKATAIDLFVKQVIGAKAKSETFESTVKVCRPILKQVIHDEFKATLLPAIQRAVLRNPEIAVEVVAHVLSEVSLDLSLYAIDLGKLLGSQLHSKEDTLQEMAILGSLNLAKQCSNSNAIEVLLKHYFTIFNGSEGKLTIISQRYGVLSGIGALSHHYVTGSESIHSLSEYACEQFVNVLKVEVHEGTLIQAASQMQLWCIKLTREIPPFLIEWFKGTPNAKTSTASAKAAYISCLNAAFKESMIQQVSDILPVLSSSALKAFTASVAQMPVLAEGLQASNLILKLCTFDKQLENQAKHALAGILDPDKLPFLTEKFIASANEDTLLTLTSFIEKLCMEFENRIKDKTRSVETALLLLMNYPSSFAVRKQAVIVCKKLLTNVTSIDFAINLNHAFADLFCQLSPKQENKVSEENGHVDSTKAVTSALLSECLKVICLNGLSNPDQVLLSAFRATHVPVIYASNPRLWITILKTSIKCPEKVDQFIAKRAGQFLDIIYDEKEDSSLKYNCVKTLVQYFSDQFLPVFLKKAIETLEKPDFKIITKTEYEIYITPEGELHETGVIDQHREESNTGNIKRESKLYSYREQMEEIELRKEMEAKKKAKGQLKEPELNKKQQEAKRLQLEKESTVRAKISAINKEFIVATNMLLAVAEGNPLEVAFRVSVIIPPVTNLFSSPVCAERAADLFLSLRKCIFDSDSEFSSLGDCIGYVTLRKLDPVCEIDPDWEEEPLKQAINRLIEILFKRTCRPVGRDYDEKSAQKALEGRLTAPAFAYTFPLLSAILATSIDNEPLTLQCLQIISEHAQMRDIQLDVIRDEKTEKLMLQKNPQYLPRKEMLEVLLRVIRTRPVHLEQTATKVLLEVAFSANGKQGCASATSEEVITLLNGCKSDSETIRLVSLNALRVLCEILRNWDDTELVLTQRIFVAQFDPHEKCSLTAKDLWVKCDLETKSELSSLLLNDIIEGESEALRISVAKAVEALLTEYPEETKRVIDHSISIYRSKVKLPVAVVDTFGRPVGDTQVDSFEPRLGVALVLANIAHLIPDSLVSDLIHFFVPEALSDRNEKVQTQMLEAGMSVVDLHGKECMALLLEVFEKYLDDAPDTLANDAVRRSVVILMGTLARHLDKEDPKVKPIVAKLIESLSTPSQIVQEAVANCLPHLIPSFKDEAPTLVHKLLQLLLESDSYGERKGAAYGIAGLVKGLGILSLKQLGIMETLTEAIQDKKNPSHREGALFAFEMLCNMLGRLFEPYIIHILPNLLLCFGDNSPRVRQATDDTSKAVMSKLSAHGVKLVLPSLLDALEEDSWRTKAGSIELLGAMAFCAPKQLSSCLPSIVPKLMMVLSDSHPKVQKAGAQALKQIGSVIRNPEIQAIVPVLLEALQDPANKTHKCLCTMLNTKFVHFIDAPSLALIMPVIERAFQGRSTETRKMAAQIIGNMYSLTDQKDLSPYLPSIIPGLKQSLLDPVPEVRSVTARALGAMVKGMGEDIFEDLMPWLMETLTSESSSVDRSGAAQGLSEVIGGLGLERMEKLMPEIIATAERVDIASHVRDGYIMLFIYLPMVFTQEFTPYIGRIINPVLKALADENEFVRETALKAGQRIVNMYAETAIQLLLPELEQGLFDDNWRIRYSSVQLLGDLLYKISGVSGKMTTETIDEDDNFGTEQSYRAIIISLGLERRNRVLSGLYMGRSDVSLSVRQVALHVWKVVVTNTPRTLKEILPTLFSLLLGCLASASYDKQQVAARTLGDLVRKLGERVLPEIIPILEQGLESDRPDQRQGVCIGLSEIIASTSREMVQAFVDSLVPTVTKALYDPLPEVRQAAAKTFDSLHSAVGVRALDEILPPLLEQLSDPESGEATLDGLRQVMAIKSRVVLPYLVPQLTSHPVNTRALALLSTVAGDSLSKHLGKILPALLQALGEALETQNEKQELEYCQAVILSVNDEQGARTIVDHLLESARNESTVVRRASVMLLYAYCCQTKAALSFHVSQLLRGLILLFTDSNEQVLHLSWDALNSVTRSLDTKEQIEYVNDVRSAVRYAASDLKSSSGKKESLLPGFCLSKGIAPILPIFREAILNGSPEQKEQAAHGLSEVIQLTSAEALKPSVVNIAGPLIRILGDRYSWNVKVAVLDTLSLLLEKVGVLLRPFIPQLQQTFLKALNDSNRTVRLRAANALSHLIQVHTRCDPVFAEMHNSFKTGNSDDPSVRETTLYALRMAITPAGDKMSDTVRRSVTSTITSLLGISEDSCRTTAAACLGALCKWLPDDELALIARDYLVDDDLSADWTLRHGRSTALRIALKEAPSRLLKAEYTERVIKTLFSYMNSDRVPLVISGVRGTTYLLKSQLTAEASLNQSLISTFARCLNHSSNEVKQVVAISAIYLTKAVPSPLPVGFVKTLVPMLVNGTKEKNTMVKAHSEQALVAVLKLRAGEETSSAVVAALDPGARESLQDCISKVLKKIALQPEPKEEEFDDTLLV